jgi:RNA polymerase sigma-70 factor, ECF subfamily
MEDTDLVGRAADGDETAFELLVRRNIEPVWRLAHSMLREDFAAEEAVQDSFLKAYSGLRQFRGDASFRTWLLAICRRVCLDRLRLTRAEVISLDQVKTERFAREDEHGNVHIQQAMDNLPTDEREAFLLVDVMGHSREEAATIVGVPPSTMRSRAARARERLALALADSDAKSNEG